jgi:hypothetical protein
VVVADADVEREVELLEDKVVEEVELEVGVVPIVEDAVVSIINTLELAMRVVMETAAEIRPLILLPVLQQTMRRHQRRHLPRLQARKDQRPRTTRQRPMSLSNPLLLLRQQTKRLPRTRQQRARHNAICDRISGTRNVRPSGRKASALSLFDRIGICLGSLSCFRIALCWRQEQVRNIED